ncbi:MAG: phosphotransferase [Gammaproteobacteria bacterium]|nr:phosphotransferase [Gammaproteobacteria bacterium]
MPQRLQQLKSWLETELNFDEYHIEPASEDASFRRYFRVSQGPNSYIVMDAPTEHEDSEPFVRLSELLSAIGLNVPVVFASDLKQGYLLLSDLGHQDYLSHLTPQTVERLYGDAMAALISLQACGPEQQQLPLYDEGLLQAEMALFERWLLQEYLGLDVDDYRQDTLPDAFQQLVVSAREQPQVCVHRDYHSRNLMVSEKNNPGILDYQDAVWGPVSYDLVSLLRDSYIQWPRSQVEEWVSGYRELAIHSGILREEVNDRQFMQWFDWMGIQRHLKVAGIFARLYCRDNKVGYLQDIPRTLEYIVDVASGYETLTPLANLVKQVVLPQLHKKLIAV